MQSRRDFVIAASSAVSAAAIGSAAAAAPNILPTTGSAPQSQLTPTEQLMYATVRLSYQTPQSIKWGTGFFFRLFSTKEQNVPVIVTNHHVVDGMPECSLNLASQLSDGSPDYTQSIAVTIDNFQNAWFQLPGVDLVIIPIQPKLNELAKAGKKPFTISLDQNLIPTDAELKDLTPVEQILTVGYPGQVWDSVHNLPVFHRGYTSTAPYIDFQGRKEFLIDITTWPGASGSPVLLYNDSGWIDRHGTDNLGGLRAKLLGVASQVATYDVGGNLTLQNGPTEVHGSTSIQVPTNLGVCIRASRILEFEPFLISKGFKPPPGYVMRAG
jgi:hypothetical protein